MSIGRAIDERTERLIALMLIGLTLAVVLPKVRETAWKSANTKSRIATVEALVHHGTFAINESPFRKTMDRIKIGDKLYSSKPPVLPTIIAGVYFVLHHTIGIDVRENRKQSAAHIVLSLIFGGGSLLLLLLFAWGLIRLLTDDPMARLFALASVGMAQYGAGYAVDVNNHLPAAALGMGALYLASSIAVDRERAAAWRFGALGFSLGLLPTIDIPSGLLSAGVGIWMLTVDAKRTFRVLVPVACLPVAFHLWLTYLYMGGFLPAQMRYDVWEKHGAGNTRDGWLLYTWNMSLGHHGVFAMVPLLVPAAIGVGRLVRSPALSLRWARPLGVVVGVVATALFFFYSVRTKNYGGVCYGFRWLIPPIAWTLPFLAVFLAREVEPLRLRWRILLPVFFAIGVSQMTGAARNPWSQSTWQAQVTEWSKQVTKEMKPEAPPPDAEKPQAKRAPTRAPAAKRPKPPAPARTRAASPAVAPKPLAKPQPLPAPARSPQSAEPASPSASPPLGSPKGPGG